LLLFRPDTPAGVDACVPHDVLVSFASIRTECSSGRPAVAADDAVRAPAGADESERDPLAGRHARSSSIPSVSWSSTETPPSTPRKRATGVSSRNA